MVNHQLSPVPTVIAMGQAAWPWSRARGRRALGWRGWRYLGGCHGWGGSIQSYWLFELIWIDLNCSSYRSFSSYRIYSTCNIYSIGFIGSIGSIGVNPEVTSLVGGWATPVEHMSQLGLTIPNMWKNKEPVPNHQSAIVSMGLWMYMIYQSQC